MNWYDSICNKVFEEDDLREYDKLIETARKLNPGVKEAHLHYYIGFDPNNYREKDEDE